jgi:hypothetical protein
MKSTNFLFEKSSGKPKTQDLMLNKNTLKQLQKVYHEKLEIKLKIRLSYGTYMEFFCNAFYRFLETLKLNAHKTGPKKETDFAQTCL